MMNRKSSHGSQSICAADEVMGEEEVPVLASERMSPMKGAAHTTSMAVGHLDIGELAKPEYSEEKG
jgi:hypothetical protein